MALTHIVAISRTPVNMSWRSVALFAPFALIASYWLSVPPEPSIAMGLLAVAAVVMTVKNMSRPEKVIWVLIAFALFYVERAAIRRDRDRHDREQAELRAEQLRHFGEIANGIRGTITQSQQHFDATMGRMETLVQSSAAIARLSKENIDAVTGGDGFVYIDVLPIPVENSGASLIAIVHGKHTIRQVSYEVTEGRPPYTLTPERLSDFLLGRAHSRHVGDLPHRGTVLGHVLQPSRENGGYYNINILALNGSINEKLELRWNSKKNEWDRQLVVRRDHKVILQRDWREQQLEWRQ